MTLKGFYIEGHGDPKSIKSKLEGSKVKCDVSFPGDLYTNPFLKIGNNHEINIVNAYYEYDDVGIWWQLDIIYYDDMISNVIVTNIDVIEDFCLQIEGQETIKKLKEEYVISDDEISEALEEQALWSLIDFHEEEMDRLDEIENLTEEQKIKYNNHKKEIEELLKKVGDE